MSEDDDGTERETRFQPPSPEVESEYTIACFNCGDAVDITDETASTLDEIDERDGTVEKVVRRYVCSESCVMEMMFND